MLHSPFPAAFDCLHQTRVRFKLSKTSIRKEFAILTTALNQAIKWQIITFNPCEAVTPPRIDKRKGTIYTPEQLQVIIDFARETNDEYHMYLPIVLGGACGLRRGEVCGLRDVDTNLHNEIASIRNSLDWEDGVLKLNPVKTDASERCIKLLKIAVEALKIEKRHQAEDKLHAGGMYQDSLR